MADKTLQEGRGAMAENPLWDLSVLIVMRNLVPIPLRCWDMQLATVHEQHYECRCERDCKNSQGHGFKCAAQPQIKCQSRKKRNAHCCDDVTDHKMIFKCWPVSIRAVGIWQLPDRANKRISRMRLPMGAVSVDPSSKGNERWSYHPFSFCALFVT